MKIRSALLFACMLVVPAMAMFSHRIPADVRAAARAGFDRLVSRWKTPAPPPAAVPAAEAAIAAAPPAVAPVTAVPIEVGPHAPTPSGTPPAVAPPVTIGSTPVRTMAGNAADRLREAGASTIDCRQVEGVTGMHVASCRVGLDASGQLVRVFHASGADAESAVRSLLADVLAWKERMAHRELPAGAAGTPESGRRF